MLARALKGQSVVAFVGSGVSAAYKRPSWSSLADAVVRETLARNDLPPRMRSLLLTAGTPPPGSTIRRGDRYVLAFDICRQVFIEAGDEPVFEDIVRKALETGPPPDRRLSADPLAVLLRRLRVRHFVTLNYDDEIERAHKELLRCEVEDIRLRPPARHQARKLAWPTLARLCPEPEAPELMLQFAVGAWRDRYTVFKAHGSLHSKERLVLGEGDYGERYLQRGSHFETYRDAMDLYLAANAVLFVGIGLEEPDVLRPLRVLLANRAVDACHRPTFALIPAEGDEQTQYERRLYHLHRHGLHLLQFPVADNDRSASLCAALEKVAEDRDHWWLEWQRKPTLRRPYFTVKAPDLMVHHPIGTDGISRARRGDESVIRDHLEAGASLVYAHGRPGLGKGTLAQRIIEGGPRPGGGRRFLASLHFVHDLVSTLQAAADFLSGTTEPGDWPTHRLSRVLSEGQHLLVITGCERLLRRVASERSPRPRGENDEVLKMDRGDPASRAARELFDALARIPPGRSQVVLMGTLLPTSLEPPEAKHHVVVSLRGLDKEDGAEILGLAPSESLLAAELHQALRGHAYALALVGGRIARLPAYRRLGEAQRLLSFVSRESSHARPHRVVDDTLLAMVEDPDAASSIEVLRHLSLFSLPTEADAIAAAFGDVLSLDLAGVTAALELLTVRRLVLAVEPASGRKIPRYLVHTLVRGSALADFQARGRHAPEAPRFQRSGFTLDADDPRSISLAGLEALFAGVDGILRALRGVEEAPSKRHLVRAAFDLLRSHVTTSVVARLSHDGTSVPRLPALGPYLSEYHRRLLRLANEVRAGDRQPGWYQRGTAAPEALCSREGWLYADEYAWLFNELGLVAFEQGHLPDAEARYRLARGVSEVIEGGKRGWRWANDEMNAAVIRIERGAVGQGMDRLRQALDVAQRRDDQPLVCRIEGWLGLGHHLAGDLDQAEGLYARAIVGAREIDNHRALSVFSKGRADLRRHVRDFRGARDDIRQALAAAEAGRHPDLRAFALLAEVVLDGAEPGVAERAPAHSRFRTVEEMADFAKSLGSARLQAEVLAVHCRLHLATGNLAAAWELAKEALALTRYQGMKLRFLSTLALAGEVALLRGRRAAGASILRAARARSEEVGYFLAAERVRRLLSADPER